MIFFPAIDIKDSVCVRLLHGDMKKATVYNDDPGEQARIFVTAGCEWLHIIDLDGAVEGRVVNAAAVGRVIANADVPIQLGGGIRSMEIIDRWLQIGVSRVILGTAALHDPELVKDACKKFPGKIAVSIDARDGMVAVSGWTKTSDMKAEDLALKMEDAGVCAVIFTDINRDGALTGVNVEATAALAKRLKTPVIASGGVASIEDIKALKKHEDIGIAGVISGRAIYDGRLSVEDAVRVLKSG